MTEAKLIVEQVDSDDAIPFDLLELADPSRTEIDKYVKTGTCYVAKMSREVVGVFILDEIDSVSIEIKNIAVKETEQGKGFGKLLLWHCESISQALGYHKLVIGTGNSSIGQLALYQKAGFEVDKIDKNFFVRRYPQPIFENEIQCKHMVILEKDLRRFTNQKLPKQ